MVFDAIIIGGSYAGLSAALQLARARRNILVIDAGERRNRFAATSHGFLGQDGRAPGDIAADARKQLERYPTVHWMNAKVQAAHAAVTGFDVDMGGGNLQQASRLVLAPGVIDTLPTIPGLKERWGQAVFHCPYCHGYELNQGRIGVIATSPMSMHHALMLPDWGTTTFFTNGVFVPDEAQMAQLHARAVTVEPVPICEITGKAEVVLADRRTEAMAGLFTMSRTAVSGAWLKPLGCEMEDGPTGQFIKTDGMKQTTVRGVFACGDAARAAGSVALSVGDGAMAGAATHRSLMFPDL
jgi:thioredoxin reductase